jgi:hypothetical protein
MADHVIHIECEATLDEFVDVQMRQLRRSHVWQQSRRRSMISIGAIGSGRGL